MTPAGGTVEKNECYTSITMSRPPSYEEATEACKPASELSFKEQLEIQKQLHNEEITTKQIQRSLKTTTKIRVALTRYFTDKYFLKAARKTGTRPILICTVSSKKIIFYANTFWRDVWFKNYMPIRQVYTIIQDYFHQKLGLTTYTDVRSWRCYNINCTCRCDCINPEHDHLECNVNLVYIYVKLSDD